MVASMDEAQERRMARNGQKDVVDGENSAPKTAEYTPKLSVETANTETNSLPKTVVSVPHLQNETETPTSPVSQDGETFSLKLNHTRPRFASGNIGFVLKMQVSQEQHLVYHL